MLKPKPLNIVRPKFPPLADFRKDFEAALKSGQVTNNGPWVRQFEERLSAITTAPALAFNSGQSALMTMLAACEVQGGEVICPSFTFPATPSAIIWARAMPVFADINPRTLVLDVNDVMQRITSRTRAILSVDAYGNSSDYAALTKLCERQGIKCLFDSAPAFGSTDLGYPNGSWADAQIFSFHATKQMPTMEGGALCSRDKYIIERARMIRNFGLDHTGVCQMPGINGKMLEVCAMIGCVQLEHYADHQHRTRRQAAARMSTALTGITGLTVAKDRHSAEPNWLYLPIMIDAVEFGLDRDLVVALLEDRGIHVRTYYPACHLMPAFWFPMVTLPVTERVAREVIALPLYNDMTTDEVDRITAAIKEIRDAR